MMDTLNDELTAATPKDRLREAVFVTLGQASACWDNLEGAGVFEAERAKEAGDRLVAFVLEWAAEVER